MERWAMHRCSIFRSRFFPEPEPTMWITRYKHQDLRGHGAIWALAAVLLANGCGDGSSDPVTLLSAGSVTTYALSGSVAGLAGPGLVLADRGATVTVNPGATSFTFGSVLDAGSPYAVTVEGTPDGLTCSVANGVGSAAMADVNNVVVTCSEKFYTLRGTISGLTRTGLALANGAHIVPVAANTTSFTLPTPVAYTHGYAVTVATQPEGLTCSVSNGSGSMPASNVTSIKVKCLDNASTVGEAARDLNAKGLVLFLGLARSSRTSHF
jgi:hypothetical protein